MRCKLDHLANGFQTGCRYVDQIEDTCGRRQAEQCGVGELPAIGYLVSSLLVQPPSLTVPGMKLVPDPRLARGRRSSSDDSTDPDELLSEVPAVQKAEEKLRRR